MLLSWEESPFEAVLKADRRKMSLRSRQRQRRNSISQVLTVAVQQKRRLTSAANGQTDINKVKTFKSLKFKNLE